MVEYLLRSLSLPRTLMLIMHVILFLIKVACSYRYSHIYNLSTFAIKIENVCEWILHESCRHFWKVFALYSIILKRS